MNKFVITFALARNSQAGVTQAAHLQREREVIRQIFTLGSAWSAGQKAVFLTCDLSAAEVLRALDDHVEDADTLLLLDLMKPDEIFYLGWLPDREGLAAVFPNIVQYELR